MKLRGRYSHTIFKQLVSFTLLIGVVPLIIISIIQFDRMKKMAEEEMIRSHQQVISQYMKSVEEKLTQYQYKIALTSNSTVIQEEMLNAEANPYTKGARISEEVTKYLMLEQTGEVSSCMVYSMLEELPVYGKRVSMISNAQREGWYRQDGALENGWYTYYAWGIETGLLAMVREIISYDYTDLSVRKLGIVKLDIRLRELFEPAKANDSDSFFVLLYDDSDTEVYRSDGLEENVFAQFLKSKERENGGSESPVILEPYIIYQECLEDYGIWLLFLFENSELLGIRGEVFSWIFPAIFVIAVLVIGMSFYYTRNFSQRVQLLLGKIRSVESGDLCVRESIEGNDEIAALDKEFGHMVRELNRLIEKNYIQQLENKETQLRNLQLQINPHFLYNTLETISSMAAINHSFAICDICEKLGEVFRYSLGKNYDEFVTVEQEIHHTQNYIFIQQIRFSNRFKVVYHLDKSLSQKRVLRFILQPIVENAILHGLANLPEEGVLEISTRMEEECLVIGIEDSGVGMSLEKMEELRKYIDAAQAFDEKKHSIGVRNVHQRIKMACGEQFGIRISGALHQGSCFELWLPLL